ncbi:SRPBCC family protein [Deinococcus misasensis]|uniref:SRPBCC family protein n=1 Tax=Deinococcus misasensis TaxID=392413 RepID=UPI0005534787|nr:SRPBCC family protein [Deinococcus misasensis]
MPTIILTSTINASIDVVFDLSRSIDLHMIGAAHTREKAVAGKTSGLIHLNEEVTWQAVHFGMPFTLSTRVTRLERPYYFVTEMVRGPFKSLKHEHRFRVLKNGDTEMKEIFEYKLPLGVMGSAAEHMFMTRYFQRFLSVRNNTILQYAETEQWMELLHPPRQTVMEWQFG